MNTSNTVIISTVGTGSRLGNLTKNLNKALVPFKGKPTLSHILENFPKELPIIILTGYKKEQIVEYCTLVHNDRNITFVDVDDWTSPASGTAYSLRKSKEYITGPFWYVACDTYFNEEIYDPSYDKNIYFTNSVQQSMSQHYCMFQIIDNHITDIVIKKETPDTYVAFVGLMFIYEWEKFFSDLENTMATEFVDIIRLGDNTKELRTWLDFGNLECYLTSLAKSQKYDYSKNDEVTYIDNKKVIKWWVDNSIPLKKYEKACYNLSVFPNNVKQKEHWICYDYLDGQTLYQYNNSDIMPDFLRWLETEVWEPIEDDKLYNRCVEFYEVKSLNRINQFLQKYPSLPKVSAVNGIPVEHHIHYLKHIDWKLILNDNRSYFIHGDLQFDNVIITKDKQFRLIDWRQEFAGSITSGDIYYDYAKMLGGCLINYSQIKEHNFKVEQVDNEITLHVPNIDNVDKYIQYIKDSAGRMNLNFKKIKALVPLIYWNMSPLHGEPFNIFLWYYAMKLFEENV